MLRRAFMTGGPAAVAAAWMDGPLAAAVPAQATAARPGGTGGGGRRTGRAAHQAARRPATAPTRCTGALPIPAGRLRLARRRGPTPQRLGPAARRSRRTGRLRGLAGARLGPLRGRAVALRRGAGHRADGRRPGPGGTRLLQHGLPRPGRGPPAGGRTRRTGRACTRPAASARPGCCRCSPCARPAAGPGWARRRPASEALSRARTLFDARRRATRTRQWMTFFGEAELEGLECQCWSALRAWGRAATHARRAVAPAAAALRAQPRAVHRAARGRPGRPGRAGGGGGRRDAGAHAAGTRPQHPDPRHADDDGPPAGPAPPRPGGGAPSSPGHALPSLTGLTGRARAGVRRQSRWPWSFHRVSAGAP